jgi:hypothetical protein
MRHQQRLEAAYVADNNPVLVRLVFDPLAAGKIVTVTGAAAIAIDPPQPLLQVQATGECLVSLTLDEFATRGHITFSCEGRATTLPLARANREVVTAREKPNGGAR